MAIDRQLAAIDKQIALTYQLYRKWHDGTSAINPVEALETIDLLLEQRRDLTHSQGELRHPDDVATTEEWGTAG